MAIAALTLPCNPVALWCCRSAFRHHETVHTALQPHAQPVRRSPPARLRAPPPVAAAGSAGFGSTETPERLPESREEAVQQAAAAIAAQLGGGKKPKGSKGFSGPGGRRLSVEVPDADSSSAATLRLAQDIIAALPRKLSSQFTIVMADSPVAPTSAGPAAVRSLQQCLERGQALSDCIVIAGAKQSQIGDVQQLLEAWTGVGAVLLNTEWDAVAAPAEQTDFILSWEAAYCFQPLSIQAAVIIRQEGAIFRFATSSNAAAAPWRIFLREKDSWVPVGRMQHRPGSSDIESAFAAAAAVKSPLTQGAKMLRGLFDKVQGQK